MSEDKPKTLPSRKIAPYRILVFALFARVQWISRYWDGLDAHVYMLFLPLQQRFGLARERIRGYFQWLQDLEYIRDLEFDRRGAHFAVRAPDTWNWNGEFDDSATPSTNEVPE